MFPISDHNPTLRTPVTTYVIIGINVAVWLLVQGMGNEPSLSRSVCQLGLIPGDYLRQLPSGYQIPLGGDMACVVTPSITWYAPLTSMFLHGSWFHLIGNMWFLHVFGNNVEDVMGRARFVAYYLLCGLAAAAAQMAAGPSSAVPMVGASGAIGGVMGGYVVLYPWARIRTFVFIFFVEIPAIFMLGYWFVLQLASGAAASSDVGGVAFWAHVGGFLAGLLLVPLFRDPEMYAIHRQTTVRVH